MVDVLLDALLDTAKMLPFLFLAYLIIEYIERRYSSKIEGALSGTGRCGFAVGGVLGLVPQCGFSAMASGLYASRAITAGTLVAVFISTSDEAIPVLLSSPNSAEYIIPLLMAKLLIALIAGFLIDIVFRKIFSNEVRGGYSGAENEVKCEKHIEQDSILLSAFKHTLRIGSFVLIVNLALGFVTFWLGDAFIAQLVSGWGFMQPLITGLIGLVPSCAISIVITQLFAVGTLSFGGMLAGLCSGAGAGLLVLLKANKNFKQNIFIISAVYIASVAAGFVAQLIM